MLTSTREKVTLVVMLALAGLLSSTLVWLCTRSAEHASSSEEAAAPVATTEAQHSD